MLTCSIAQVRKAALCAILLVSATGAAQQEYPLPLFPTLRSMYFSKEPGEPAPEVFVAGGVVTTLRFETPCDPSRTKLTSWEGRFEQLVVSGKSVFIIPLQNLGSEDRIHLVVTLLDGTSLPFTLAASKFQVDGQVNVFPDPESPGAIRTALKEVRHENQTLRADNHRHKREETSVEHALATLLATGATSLTPFQEETKWVFDEKIVKTYVHLFKSKERKALVFTVTNLHPETSWQLEDVRLMDAATAQPKSVALRMQPSSLAPGETGRIAIVMEPTSPTSPGRVYSIELFGKFGNIRTGGFRQAFLTLKL